MDRSIGLLLLFQRRYFRGGLDEVAAKLKHMTVTRGDGELTITDARGASIVLYFESQPDRIAGAVGRVNRDAPDAIKPMLARCDGMLVALWDRAHDVADLSLEVCYLESLVKGITYYANIGELASDHSFPSGSARAGLDDNGLPLDDAALTQRLHGAWRLDPRGTTSMTFTPTGDLVYSEAVEGGTQRILLTFRVENTELVTDQPSKPSEQRSPISFAGDGSVTLWDLGGPHRFVRDREPADPDAALHALVGVALRHGVGSSTPGGAMSPFVLVENAAGERTLIRFITADGRAHAERAVREAPGAVAYAYAADANLAIDGQRTEAIVVEGGRRGRTGAIMAALRYVAGDNGEARADGPQLGLAETTSWLA